MDKRRIVINKAKELAESGERFRFFSMDGEIWECYQSEFLPFTGERPWIAELINVYIIPGKPCVGNRAAELVEVTCKS